MGHPTTGHGTALPEPKTPMWLPALGAVLFLAVALFWGLCSSDKPETKGASDAAPAASGAPAH